MQSTVLVLYGPLARSVTLPDDADVVFEDRDGFPFDDANGDGMTDFVITRPDPDGVGSDEMALVLGPLP